MDYYATLNLTPSAKQDEIKKSYRALSLKHHPDRNNNSKESEEIFKKIGEAYDTLGDVEKRQQYDYEHQDFQTQSVPSNMLQALFKKKNGRGSAFNEQDIMETLLEEIFENHFMKSTINSHLGMHFNGSQQPSPPPPPPMLSQILELDLCQAYNGGIIPLEINRYILYDKCTREIEHEILYITIPKGVDNDEVIIIKEKGHVNGNGTTSDLKITIKVSSSSNHAYFQRDGLHFIYEKTITLKESLCGFVFEIDHINGKKYRLHNPKGNIIHQDVIKKIPNLGVIREDQVGDLIVVFHIEFPKHVDVKVLDELEKLDF